jgi:sirohydrochlorin cobaltochelatase
MKLVVVLAMHGVPPKDFPRPELSELFALHGQVKQATGAQREALQRRHDAIEDRMRAWPRTPQNDPFHAGSLALAEHMSRALGAEVVVGFNEFCGPSIDEALDAAVARGADRIAVITPMMTSGGEHSEKDIPHAIARAQARHPQVPMVYAWPFDMPAVAAFLAAQITRTLESVPAPVTLSSS